MTKYYAAVGDPIKQSLDEMRKYLPEYVKIHKSNSPYKRVSDTEVVVDLESVELLTTDVLSVFENLYHTAIENTKREAGLDVVSVIKAMPFYLPKSKRGNV